MVQKMGGGEDVVEIKFPVGGNFPEGAPGAGDVSADVSGGGLEVN